LTGFVVAGDRRPGRGVAARRAVLDNWQGLLQSSGEFSEPGAVVHRTEGVVGVVVF